MTWVSWASCVTDRNSDIGHDGASTGIFYGKVVSVVVCEEETNLTEVHVALCFTSSVTSKHVEVRKEYWKPMRVVSMLPVSFLVMMNWSSYASTRTSGLSFPEELQHPVTASPNLVTVIYTEQLLVFLSNAFAPISHPQPLCKAAPGVIYRESEFIKLGQREKEKPCPGGSININRKKRMDSKQYSSA